MGFTIVQRKGQLKRRTLALDKRKIETDIMTPRGLAKKVLTDFLTEYPIKPKRCLEPCAGFGSLVKAMKETFGKTEIVSIEKNYEFDELTKKGDFFEMNNLGKFDFIYCNPPFTPVKICQAFFTRCLNLLTDEGYLLMYVPVYWLNNSDRRLQENFGYIRKIKFLPKMSFGRPMHNAVIVAQKKQENTPFVKLF